MHTYINIRSIHVVHKSLSAKCINVHNGPAYQILTQSDDTRVAELSTTATSVDTSLIRDIYCGPEVLFETCVAMKFVDDDDDDD